MFGIKQYEAVQIKYYSSKKNTTKKKTLRQNNYLLHLQTEALSLRNHCDR